MVERIEQNTQPKLIGGARPRPAAPAARRKPEDVFVGNSGEKRYLWTARAFATVTAISLCCNLVLVFAIMQVIPLSRIEPFLLTFQNKSEQVYAIQPVKMDEGTRRAISEVFVRQYVLMRSAFDGGVDELEARWGTDGAIREMSTAAIYNDFLSATANKALELVRTKGLTRSVKILTVNDPAPDRWQVEYETSDMYPDSRAPETNYWMADLTVEYRRKSARYGDRLKNPIGFTVIRYSLQRKNVN